MSTAQQPATARNRFRNTGRDKPATLLSYDDRCGGAGELCARGMVDCPDCGRSLHANVQTCSRGVTFATIPTHAAS